MDVGNVPSGAILRGRSLPLFTPALSSAVLRRLFVLSSTAAPVATLLGVALAARLHSQPGVPLYPDSYEFLLAAKRLNPLAGMASTLGPAGDLWSIPFHRIGFSLLAAPLSTLPDALSALSLAAGVLQGAVLYLLLSRFARSRLASLLVALLVATSFSAVAWSRLPMSDSTALLLALASILLLLLAAESCGASRATAVVVALGLALATRADLVLLFPGLLALPWSLHRPDASARVAWLLLASLLLWLAAIAILMVALDGNVRGLEGGLWGILQANLLAPGGMEGTFGTGLRAFASRELPLLAVAGLGAVVSIGRADRRGVAAALLVAVPFTVYATRDDFRYYAYLIPGLSMMAAIGLEGLAFPSCPAHPGLRPLPSVRRGPHLSSLARPAVAATITLGLFAGVMWQWSRLAEAWHPEPAYAEEAARSVSLTLKSLGIPSDAAICAPQPEAYFLETGRSTRYLLPERPASCLRGLAAGQQMVIVADALVQSAWRNGLPAGIAAWNPRLLATAPLTGAVIVGEKHYLATTPIRVFMLAKP